MSNKKRRKRLKKLPRRVPVPEPPRTAYQEARHLWHTLPGTTAENRRRIAFAFIGATGVCPDFTARSFEVMARDPADAILIASQAELIAGEMAELRKLYPPSVATQLLHSLDFTKQEHRRTIALAFIEEGGDVPLWLEHTFLTTSASSEDADAAMQLIDELRAVHFAKLGKPVPKRSGPPLR